MRYFLQYHIVAKRGIPGLPIHGESELGIWTEKPNAGGVSKGDCVLLIAGFPAAQRRREYRLWCHFSVNQITKQDGEFFVSGPGRYLLLPPLLGQSDQKQWAAFLRYMQNFRRGFSPIDGHAYLKHLLELCDSHKRKVSNARIEDFCSEMLSMDAHVKRFCAEDVSRLYECRGLIRLARAKKDPILRSMAKKDCLKANQFYKECGETISGQLKKALEDLKHDLPSSINRKS